MMKGWLFPYGVWYALAVWAALCSAAGVAAGSILNAAGCGLIAAGVGAVVIRSRVRWSRSGEKTLRAEMIRLVDERDGSAAAWLNRDAHLLFGTGRRRVGGMRERMLMVLDEDQQRDVEDTRDAGGGRLAVTAVSYMAHPVLSRVARKTDGTTAMVTAADIEQADASERDQWWRWQGYAEMIAMIRSGLAFADAGDLAEVLAQFRDAEPISRAGEGPKDRETAS